MLSYLLFHDTELGTHAEISHSVTTGETQRVRARERQTQKEKFILFLQP